MRGIKGLILAVLPLLLVGTPLFAQIEEKRKEADKLFEDGKFVEATTLYNQLLAQNKKDHDVNFRYGTCLLYNSHNKEEAIPFLRYSTRSKTIDPRAYFYLGRAYHLNYQFTEAIKKYEEFKKIGSSSQIKDLDVDGMVEACKNGKKLMANLLDMVVLEKTEIKEESFYEIYNLENIGGTILRTDEFQTKLDEKKGHRPIIHFPKGSPNIFYSSYGEDGETGLDIYQIRRLPDGSWSKAQKVKGSVNTFSDEAYAFMHPNGKYLYFCSKGHNSMGGYDVFKSKYNPGDDSFDPPENLDFAISSPDDDIFFLVDSLNKYAYFASARESQNGKIYVYNVRVERIPMQMAVIKGNFINEVNPLNKKINIEIEDFATNRSIGPFNSQKSDGDYLITFPKGGKYKFYVTPGGSEVTHYAEVEVPYMKKLRPLKQKMTLVKLDNGETELRIENLFDEEFENPEEILAEVYNEIDDLMPNADDFDLDSLDDLAETAEKFEAAGLDPFATKDDILKVLEDEQKEIEEAIEVDREQVNTAYNLGSEKSDEANEEMVEINKLVDELKETDDAIRKNEILEEIQKKRNKVEQLDDESEKLVELAGEIEKSLGEKEALLGETKKVSEAIKAVDGEDRNTLVETVGENESYFRENVKEKSELGSKSEEILSNEREKAKKSAEMSNEISDLVQKKSELEKDTERLKEELENAKRKERDQIEDKIEENESLIALYKSDINDKQKAYDDFVKESEESDLYEVAEMVSDDEYDNPDYNAPLTEEEKNAITTKIRKNDLDESIASVDEVLDQNNVNDLKVNLFADDETTSGYSLNDWKDEIDKQVRGLEEKKATASPEEQEKIEEEITKLRELKEEKEKEFGEEVASSDIDLENLEADVEADELVEDFDNKKEEIEKIADEGDRRRENKQLNEEIVGEIDSEMDQLKELKKENPDNETIAERIENLEDLKKDIDDQIKEDEGWLTENDELVKTFDQDEVIDELDSDYQDKINEAYNIEDESERAEEISSINENLNRKANERIQELNAILEGDPENESAKNELEALKELKKNLETNASDPVVEPILVDVENVDTKVEESDFAENFESRKDAIDEIENEYSRRGAENDLLKEMSAKVKDEIEKYDAAVVEHPGNKDLQKKLNNLKKLDDKLHSTIVENENWRSSNPPEISDEPHFSDVKAVSPGYEARVNEIADIEDEEQRKEAIRELNDDAKEDINNRLAELNKILAENPDDIHAQAERKKLLDLKSQIENNPEETLIQPTVISMLNTEPEVEDVMPEYQAEKDRIRASGGDEKDRERNKWKLNKKLVDLIDTEIGMLEKLKEKNPDETDDIDDRIDELNKIKEDKLEEIAESEEFLGDDLVENTDVVNNTSDNQTNDTDNNTDNITSDSTGNNSNETPDNTNTTEREKITVLTLLPDFGERMVGIENSSDTELDKLKLENGVHNDVVSAADQKIEDLQTEKETNPDQVEAIDKDIQTAENIKKSQLNEINKNNERISELSTTADTENNRSNENADNTDTDNSDNRSNETTDNQTNETTDNIDTENNTEREEINLLSLLPDFGERMSGIENSPGTELDKLKMENGVHNDVISAADERIEDLKIEKETNPGELEEIDKDIQKVENIKKSQLNEINKNNERISELSTTADTENNRSNENNDNTDTDNPDNRSNENNDNSDNTNTSDNTDSDLTDVTEEVTDDISDTDISEVKSPENREIVNDLQGDIDEADDLKAEIKDLEEDLNSAESEKDKKKIEKKINKRRIKLAKVENDVIEELGPVNEDEFDNNRSSADSKIDEATAGDPFNPDIDQAEKDLSEADRKIKQAKMLRSEAEQIKDPTEKNRKLKKALLLEREADVLVEKTERTLKAATVVSTYNKDKNPEVVTDVPDEPAQRKSTKMCDVANDMELKANEMSERAQELRDSSETVRKKYREDIITEADQLDEKAGQLRINAASLKEDCEQLKQQEEEILAARIGEVDKPVDDDKKNDIASTGDYKTFVDKKNSGDENMNKASEVAKEIEEKKDRQARIIKNAVVSGTSEADIAQDEDVQRIQESIDSLRDIQEGYKRSAMNDYETANRILDEHEDEREDFIALENNDVEPIDKSDVATVTDPEDADYKAPESIGNSLFRTTETSVYSEEAPIPVNQQTSGLVYKVQIGAFRSKLPQEYYDKFAPISAEKLDNGITRYFAGYFTDISSASDARTQIRGMGYSDAFVVAYCNGERISNSRARRIEAGEEECVGSAPAVADGGNFTADDNNTTDGGTTDTDENTSDNATDNTTTDNQNETEDNTTTDDETTTSTETDDNTSNVEITPSNESEEELVSYYTDVEGAAPANQIEIIKGLFYTVQIGAYRTPVSNDVLYNIQPLNSQKSESGLIRYSTGLFTNRADATQRKDEVVEIGIGDAFVTAYYNGERIGASRADELLQEKGSSILYNSPEVGNNLDGSGDGSTDSGDNGTDEPEEQFDDVANDYIVELGYFSEETEDWFKELMDQNPDEDIKSQLDFDDGTVYFSGPFKTKAEADQRMDELKSKGFDDAVIRTIPAEEEPPPSTEEQYFKEGVYYRVLVGKFEEAIPGEYATLLFQAENMFDTEQDIEGNTYLYSTKIPTLEDAIERAKEFADMGVEEMEIVSYYKYDPVPMEQAEKILNEEPVGELTPFETPRGVSADDYIYQKEAVYFKVLVGRFENEVPTEFANAIFSHPEENIEREETFEGEILFYSESAKGMDEIKKTHQRLIDKGFDQSEIVAFHKYDQISVEKAKEILGLE